MPFESRLVLTTFIQAFLQELEQAYRRFLGTELLGIIEAHIGLAPGPLPGYLVGDQAYYCLDGKPLVTSLQYLPFGILPKALSPVLMERHKQWIQHFEQHDRDFPRIKQVLSSVLLKAKEPQDLRDMLPEHVIQPMLKHEILSRLTRSRPDLYAGLPDQQDEQYVRERQRRELYWDRALLNMYERIGPMVDTYLGYKFLA